MNEIVWVPVDEDTRKTVEVCQRVMTGLAYNLRTVAEAARRMFRVMEKSSVLRRFEGR